MTAITALSDEEIQAALDTLGGGWLTMGPRIQHLETTVSERYGVEHAIALSSGTAALHLVLRAVGVADAGVVIGGLAGVGLANAGRVTGAVLQVADVVSAEDPRVSVAQVEAAATAETRIVVVSHGSGVPVDVVALRALADERGWLLVEDATEAFGATLADGTPAGFGGHVGCFSFAAGRIIGVGEGGMVVTNDPEIGPSVRRLRSHAMTSVTWDRHRGHADSYDITDIGFNFRMDEPRAAIVGTRLGRLGELVDARRAAAEAVRAAVTDIDGVAVAWPEELPSGAAPQAVPLLFADAQARDRFAQAAGALARLHAASPGGSAPHAEAARERTALVDLGAAEVEGLDADGLASAVRAAAGA